MASIQPATGRLRRRRPFRARWQPALLALLLSLALTLAQPWHPPAHAQTAAPAPGAAGSSAAPRTGEEIRGVWFTANDMDVLRDRTRMQQAVRQLAALHFNTLYPVVWNSGFAYYPSAVSEREGLQDFQYRGLQGQDILRELIEEAHSQGLLVLPWFEFGFMVPPGSTLTRRHPDWLSQRRDGTVTSVSAAGEVSWLNPLHPQVQALLSELILEIATQYDADGIQFDDHTSLPSDFGYDATTTGLYKRSMGREPPANPVDAAWLQWRADGISAFMRKLHGQLQQRRPGFLVSLSPNYHDFSYKQQLQDWLTWLKQGSLDEVVVQLYRPDLESFRAELRRPEFAISRQRVPTAVGILTGQRTAPVPIQRVVDQAQAARQQGLGAAFFYYETLWEEAQELAEQRKAALETLYRQPATRRAVAARATANPAGSARQVLPQQPLPQQGTPPPAAASLPGRPSANQSAAPGEAAASGPQSPSAVQVEDPPPLSAPATQATPAAAPANAPPARIPASPAIPASPSRLTAPPPPPLADPPAPQAGEQLPAVDPSWGPYNGAVQDIEPAPPATGGN